MRERIAALEARESATDQQIAALAQRAAGVVATADPACTAAAIACAGLIGRALADAAVEAASPTVAAALTPDLLSGIGTDLVLRGEWTAAVAPSAQGVRLDRASTTDVRGSTDPATWMWTLTLPAPSGTLTVERPSSAVAHLTWQTDRERPWRGVAPVSGLTARMLAEGTHATADELSGPVGHLLPVPVDGQDPSVQALRDDLSKLAGRPALVQSQSTGWDSGTANRSSPDWQLRRLGADPPDSIAPLLAYASTATAAACGIPPELLEGTSTRRESHLTMLRETVEPLGRRIAAEIERVTGSAVVLRWADLDLERAALAARAAPG